MMKCIEITRSAGDFLEHRLRLRRRVAFLMHIAMCRGCRAYVDQLRLTILGLRAVRKPIGPEPSASLLREYRAHRHRDE